MQFTKRDKYSMKKIQDAYQRLGLSNKLMNETMSEMSYRDDQLSAAVYVLANNMSVNDIWEQLSQTADETFQKVKQIYAIFNYSSLGCHYCKQLNK